MNTADDLRERDWQRGRDPTILVQAHAIEPAPDSCRNMARSLDLCESASEYITKPCDRAQIEAIVQRYLYCQAADAA